MMKLHDRRFNYDEENGYDDNDVDDLAGYEVDDSRSVFAKLTATPDEPTIATPIPQNESTVILSDPMVAGLTDGKELAFSFEGDGCAVICGKRKVGTLKEAFVRKLRAERGGQLFRAYFKEDIPPMVRLVFGEGNEIPKND